MKKTYLSTFFIAAMIVLLVFGCSKSDEPYLPVPPVVQNPTSPVVLDITQVPYAKLSDYKFFDGEMKNLQPALNVLPYEPASSLFSDYSHKKRFVWMPTGTKANFDSENKILEIPVGAVLIKNFYYENVQNITPVGGTRIIETRLLFHKADGYLFADYVWNAEQTEAFYDNSGSFTDISWKDENNVVKSTQYRIPSEVQCIVCHKNKKTVNGAEVTVFTPIGIKPQNLNYNYSYSDGSKNQLQKWIDVGYLSNNFTFPDQENTVIDYRDQSKSLELRSRSYFDANCAHCHHDGGHCDYRAMRFDFTSSGNSNGQRNLGVCLDTEEMQNFPTQLNKVIAAGNAENSMLYYRLKTTDETYRMPLHGRTVIHEEGVSLIRDWINSLHPCE